MPSSDEEGGSPLADPPMKPGERQALIAADKENSDKYGQMIDRESAYERLQARNNPVGMVKQGMRKFGSLFGLKG